MNNSLVYKTLYII